MAANVRGALSTQVVSARAAPKGSRSHVPYRNATLTFLLQDALSGDAKMAFVVCVSAR